MLKARTTTNVYKLSVYLLITFMSRSDKQETRAREKSIRGRSGRSMEKTGWKILSTQCELCLLNVAVASEIIFRFSSFFFLRGLLTFNPISVSDATEQIFSFIPTRFNPLLVSRWLQWVRNLWVHSLSVGRFVLVAGAETSRKCSI